MKRPRRISPWLSLVVASAVLLLGASAASGQMIDLNGNGMSDVWEAVYNANGINPNADPDGDGFSNLQEAVAGTNPFSCRLFHVFDWQTLKHWS